MYVNSERKVIALRISQRDGRPKRAPLGLGWKAMELAEIQQAIEQLPKDQQAALAAWLAERDQAEWAR